jgi:hypothetical protein
MAKSRIAHEHDQGCADHRGPEPKRPEWAPPQGGVTVGSAHDPAERDADALAARVLRKLSGGEASAGPAHAGNDHHDEAVHRETSDGAKAGAFEADPKTSADLRGRVGMGQSLGGPLRGQLERGFGTSLSGVKVHTDANAGRLADSFNAEAFTHGKDVFFGRNRFDPQSESGRSLLVHELAHVVQGGGQQPVRRKLKGSLSAVEEGKGKAGKGEKFFKTDYAKILEKLKAFEKREDKVLAQKNFGKLGTDRFWMEKTLRDVIKMIDEWLADNDKFGDEKVRNERSLDLYNKDSDAYEQAVKKGDEAERERITKAARGGTTNQRARALSMLRPRLVVELQDIADPVSYFQGKQLVDANLDRSTDYTKDDAVGGAQNRLDRVQYQGGKKGYFIADKSMNTNVASSAIQTKIDQVDPNIGARSVASSRLAKLFGANEIVDVQFAVHSSKTDIKGKPLKESLTKLGVVSEAAEGMEGAELRFATSGGERKDLESRNEQSRVANLGDPTLQRSLNILQMLDYISLQMDRHTRNFYVATDAKGKVLGIKGIDLDLSFGKMGKEGKVDAETGSGKFVGVPQLADAKFREKVLQVTPDQISKCLTGLITPSEVAACLERFAYLQKVLREIDPKKIVQEGGWNDDTAKEQLGQANYINKLRTSTIDREYGDDMEEVIKPLNDYQQMKLRNMVRPAIEDGRLTVGHGRAVRKTLVNSFLESPVWKRLYDAKMDAAGRRTEANRAYDKLVADKKALAPGHDTKDIDEQIMAADLARKEKDELARVAGMEHDEAVDSFIKAILDYAVRRSNRLKPKQPGRRPSLGAHRTSSSGAKV